MNPSDITPTIRNIVGMKLPNPHAGAYFCTSTSLNPNEHEVASAAPMLSATRRRRTPG